MLDQHVVAFLKRIQQTQAPGAPEPARIIRHTTARMYRGQQNIASKGSFRPFLYAIPMAGEGKQGPPVKSTRAKKRIVTSCLECYRRKQKCDRKKPCNFCSARGLPEICHYDTTPNTASIEKRIYKHTAQSNIPPRSHDPNDTSEPIGLLDQFGYSLASQRDDFLLLNGYSSEPAASDASNEKLITITDTATYLDLTARLPSSEVRVELIKAFFSIESWSFPILDENHFRNLQKRFESYLGKARPSESTLCMPCNLSSFPGLLFSVLALAMQFLPPDCSVAHSLDIHTSAQADVVSASYIDAGQEVIELFKWQKPTATSIQFYLAKMVWQKNYGRGSTSWQTLGIALRQAQEIDLHRIQEDGTQAPGADLGHTLTRLWEIEHRKRLWARIFVMDSHMAVALGRPRGIHREDCSTCAPLDCEYPIIPSQTVPTNTKHTHEPPNSFSSVVFSIALGHKYHDLMSLRSAKVDLMDYSRVQKLHQEVQSLLNELPPALRPSFPDTRWDSHKPQLPAVRQRLLTTANVFFLALHRPLVATHLASRYAAVEAAFDLLQSQQRIFGMIHSAQHKLYGHSFYTIHTGIFLTTLVVKYMETDSETCTRALQELQQAATRLAWLKERSPLAKTGELILRQCCAVIDTRITLPFSVNSPVSFDMDERLTTAIDFFQNYDADVSQQTEELVSLLTLPPDAPTVPYVDSRSENVVPWQF